MLAGNFDTARRFLQQGVEHIDVLLQQADPNAAGAAQACFQPELC